MDVDAGHGKIEDPRPPFRGDKGILLKNKKPVDYWSPGFNSLN